MNTVQLEFESLPMRRRELIKFGGNQYRIIDSNGEFKNVEANTAYEAFKLSGLSDAIKIERLVNVKHVILPQSEFTEKALQESAENNTSEATSEEAMTEAALFEQSRKLMKTIISANDLDKFMQSRISEELIAAEALANATGTEVHGDGFDEIIPAAPAQPAAKATAAPAKEAATHVEIPQGTPEAPITPEKTLSAEEVEKLLNNNG